MMVKNSDWDIDYANGLEGEHKVADILGGNIESVEVKRDIKWLETGNIYVETECFYQTSGQWEPSGLSVTKATHWAFVLGESVLLLPTDDLRKVVEVEGIAKETNIQPNPTRGFLVTPEKIFRMYQYSAPRE